MMSADLYVANANGAAASHYSNIKGKQLKKAASRNDSVGEYNTVTADQYMHKTGTGKLHNYQSDVQIKHNNVAKSTKEMKDSGGSDAVLV